MKVIACLLFACLAVAVFAQNPAGGARAMPGAAQALAAAAASRGGSGTNILALGAMTGGMGDGLRDMVMCQMMGLPRFLCLTRMMQ